MLKRLINSQTKSVNVAAGILAGSTLVSAILGLIRDRLLAGQFGASRELDIYFTAFRIPDFVFNLLIGGGILVAFLPLFSEYFAKDKENAWKMANYVLNIFFSLLSLLSLVLFIFTPQLINLIAPGFNGPDKSMAVMLTRLLFLSPILFGVANIFSGILLYFNRFLAYSIAPILYNIGIIFGILFFVPSFGLMGLGFGVIMGALMYLLVQIPSAVISGYRPKPYLSFKYPAIQKIFKLMVPRVISISAQQINLFAITAIASTITAGSIAVFSFSNNLQALPVNLIGLSFATASFPLLARIVYNGGSKEFSNQLSSIFRHILFLIIPASFFIFILRAQITRIVLGTGRFGWDDTKLVAASLGIFCFSIFAQALIPLLIRSFFALQDTKTPTAISLVSISANIFLSFMFVWLLSFQNIFSDIAVSVLRLEGVESASVVGLPLAFSCMGVLQFALLFLFLGKKVSNFNFKEIFRSLEKIFIASCFMALSSYLALRVVAQFVNMQTFNGIFWQTFSAAFAGGLAYFIFSLFLKISEMKTLIEVVLTRINKLKNGIQL